MKQLFLPLLFFTILLSSCDEILGKKIIGNGHTGSEQRSISSAERIKLAGSYEVELTQGSPASLRIEADDNLLPYIVTENEDGELTIKTKAHYRLSASHPIKVYITTEQLEALTIAGSGNIRSNDKFTGSNELAIKISGSGDIYVNINTPGVKADIAGSGNIHITGETKDELIKIAGHGDYKGEDLKAENAEIHIAGSGNVKVFADNKLEIHIAGSGDVYYKGNATIEQHIAGSGTIKKIQ